MFATENCYGKAIQRRRKLPRLGHVTATVTCYGFCPKACSYEGIISITHTRSVAVQPLSHRTENWRSLRTDSLKIAMRRLHGVITRIEIEIEHRREMAGLPLEVTFRRPLQDEWAAPSPTMHRPMIIAAKGFAIRYVG